VNKKHFTIFLFYFFIGLLVLCTGCGKKEIVKERSGKPLFIYKKFTHGVSPRSLEVKIYDDGYIVSKSEDLASGKMNREAKTLRSKEVVSLKDFFLDRDFLNAEPIDMPALYGGEVITITFNYEGKENTIKFLKGTKLPLSVERCWDRLEDILTDSY
jgi:hypothetical protein